MALKTLMLLCLLVAAMALIPPMAEAQLSGLISGLLGLIKIQGTVFCTVDGNMGVNGTATPVFPSKLLLFCHHIFPRKWLQMLSYICLLDALVQLQCGGNVVSSSTTNGSGIFSILLDPLQFLVPSLINNCNLAVKTPLSNCNASLPSIGGLSSTLQVIGSTVAGLLNITNIIPTGFGFLRAWSNSKTRTRTSMELVINKVVVLNVECSYSVALCLIIIVGL